MMGAERREKTNTSFSAVSSAVLVLPGKEVAELSEMVHIVKDPLEFSISLRLHVNVVNLEGTQRILLKKSIFFAKKFNFFWINTDFFA